jgi:hypothetical protein
MDSIHAFITIDLPICFIQTRRRTLCSKPGLSDRMQRHSVNTEMSKVFPKIRRLPRAARSLVEIPILDTSTSHSMRGAEKQAVDSLKSFFGGSLRRRPAEKSQRPESGPVKVLKDSNFLDPDGGRRAVGTHRRVNQALAAGSTDQGP